MMKTMWQRMVPMLAALTALAACSSTPTVYYQLPDSAFVSANTPKQTVWTNVYVVLAEPLNRQSLLYQSDEHTVQMTQHNLWAAPLSNGLAAAVANKLNRQSSLHSDYSITNKGSPYSTGVPFSTKMALTTPDFSASISFISFMASMMHRVWPSFTVWPTSTNGSEVGLAAR